MNLVFHDIIPFFPLLVSGLLTSLYITVICMLAGTLIGLFVALSKASKNVLISFLGNSYIEVFRNTPLIIQLYIIFFGLGQLGIDINPLWSAVIGITMNNAAYTAEIFRAGFSSVPKGLNEAGSALGMNSSQIFRHVILPPAVRTAFPALTNQLILLFLFSSVASVISLEELTYQVMNIETQTSRTLEITLIATLLYYGCSSVFVYLSNLLSKKVFKW
ncbi:amino acid ABC transporter permease [Cytobacillus depressus]|uniref:Amino acid ABC transporter permease n=1 Tax=Cytobacillus depressus TaxID=1602942 RepID=A0A6L3V1H0_9BACI|nr:amino acid ABC transporter permease [Cytobacillus depressus]KAB2329551.1 amino acid ABC transporter permease [Cytobacillus depressus]